MARDAMYTDKEIESDKHFCVASASAFKNWCLQDITIYNLGSQVLF